MFSFSVLELFVRKNVIKMATKNSRFTNACGKFFTTRISTEEIDNVGFISEHTHARERERIQTWIFRRGFREHAKYISVTLKT